MTEKENYIFNINKLKNKGGDDFYSQQFNRKIPAPEALLIRKKELNK